MEFLIVLGIIGYNMYTFLQKRKEGKDTRDDLPIEERREEMSQTIDDECSEYKKMPTLFDRKEDVCQDRIVVESPAIYELDSLRIETDEKTSTNNSRHRNLRRAMMWHIVLSEPKCRQHKMQ